MEEAAPLEASPCCCCLPPASLREKSTGSGREWNEAEEEV